MFCVIIAFSVTFFSKKIAVFLLAIILILFAGTRSDIDNDYFLYRYFFRYVNNSVEYFKSNFESLEFSIFLIPNFLKIFLYKQDDIINGSFVIFALIAVSLKMYSIYKYSSFFTLSFIFYLSSLFFMHEMTTIRAGIAAGLLLLSINDFEEKKHWSFIWKMVLALLFHYSSLLILGCYLVVINIKNIKYYYYGLLIAIFFAISKINILTLLFLDKIFPKVQVYLMLQDKTNENKVNVFNFKILFSLFLLCVFFSNYKQLSKKKYFVVLYKIHILSLIIFFILSPTAIVFSLRSFELLSIIQILLAPMILFLFAPKFQYIGALIVLVFSGIQLFYIISIQDIFRPYISWLF